MLAESPAGPWARKNNLWGMPVAGMQTNPCLFLPVYVGTMLAQQLSEAHDGFSGFSEPSVLGFRTDRRQAGLRTTEIGI